MNLIIDVGNTAVKLAVYSKNKLIRKLVVSHEKASMEAISLTQKYKSINHAIISSVGKFNDSHFLDGHNEIKIIELNHKTKLPFINQYKTPKTLGVDRLALVSAALRNYPKKNVLVIDAGTCITFDFISAQKEYKGGAISPGLNMRYEAMHNFTSNLPLLKLQEPKHHIGHNTNSSMHSGIVNGVIYEIDGAIEEYRSNYKDLTVILTGGDTKFLSKRLKNTIFANSNFLLEGLNYILEFNKS